MLHVHRSTPTFQVVVAGLARATAFDTAVTCTKGDRKVKGFATVPGMLIFSCVFFAIIGTLDSFHLHVEEFVLNIFF